MVTFNNVITLFKIIADAHPGINSFGWGERWQRNETQSDLYPRLWLEPTESIVQDHTQERTFTLYVYDLVRKDKSNNQDVLSDTEQIINDIVVNLRKDPTFYSIIGDPQFFQFTEDLGDWVSGWEGDIVIQTDLNTNHCSIPISDYYQPNTPTGGGIAPTKSFDCAAIYDCQAYIDLETALQELNDEVNGIQTDVTNIQTDITNIQNDITNINNGLAIPVNEIPVGTGTGIGSSSGYLMLNVFPDQQLQLLYGLGLMVSGLAGSGNRMVIADPTGTLSTQAIPSGASLTATYIGYGDVSNNLTGSPKWTFNGSRVNFTSTILNDGVTFSNNSVNLAGLSPLRTYDGLSYLNFGWSGNQNDANNYSFLTDLGGLTITTPNLGVSRNITLRSTLGSVINDTPITRLTGILNVQNNAYINNIRMSIGAVLTGGYNGSYGAYNFRSGVTAAIDRAFVAENSSDGYLVNELRTRGNVATVNAASKQVQYNNFLTTNNITGTSINQNVGMFRIDNSVQTYADTLIANAPIAITGNPIFNLVGTTGTNLGTRLDAAGLSVRAMSNLHNANSVAFQVDGRTYLSTNGTGDVLQVYDTATSPFVALRAFKGANASGVLNVAMFGRGDGQGVAATAGMGTSIGLGLPTGFNAQASLDNNVTLAAVWQANTTNGVTSSYFSSFVVNTQAAGVLSEQFRVGPSAVGTIIPSLLSVGTGTGGTINVGGQGGSVYATNTALNVNAPTNLYLMSASTIYQYLGNNYITMQKRTGFTTSVSGKVPSAVMHVDGSTAGAVGTGPFKIDVGVPLISPESGVIERVADSLYFTIATGLARKEIMLSDTTLTAGRVPFTTTNGRLTDSNMLTYASDILYVGSTGLSHLRMAPNLSAGTFDLLAGNRIGTAGNLQIYETSGSNGRVISMLYYKADVTGWYSALEYTNVASGFTTLTLQKRGGLTLMGGTAQVTSLAGVGTRMVVADSTGLLSTQAIPTGSSLTSTYIGYGDGSNALTGSNLLTFNGTNLFTVGAGVTARITSIAGSGSRFVTTSTSGDLSSQRIRTSDPVAITEIVNTANWDVLGAYIGPTLTNLFAGQHYSDGNYFFYVIADNTVIRMARV